jgi:hypothetical protein
MSDKELLERIAKLGHQVAELRDIEDIKNLQKAYGYYIKEDGIWKIEKLRFDQLYAGTPAVGWVAPDRVAQESTLANLPLPEADIPRTFYIISPSGNICPFHHMHPVSGKKTSEGLRNSAHDAKMTGK